jgi:xylulokinase
MEALIAVDIGTSGAKATLVTRQGRIIASANAEYSTQVDGARVEQNPDDWWQATCTSLRSLPLKADGLQPAGIVLSGQMQDLILVGPESGPAILYSDVRAQPEAQQLFARLGEDYLCRVTANLQDASSLLAKLLWLKTHQPQRYQSAERLLIGAHDYIAWRLSGVSAADYTTAATTGLFHFQENRWAVELLEALGLRSDWLADLAPAEAQVGQVTAEAAQATGLPEGLPVIHGAGDAATATLGAGAGISGRFYVYLGTSGWLAASCEGLPADPHTGIFNLRHPDPARLILIGPMLTAAGNFEWLRRQFGELEMAACGQPGADAYDLLNQIGGSSPAGSQGIFYLPYLAGERAPFRDPHARGVFLGLSASTTRADLYRALLEGVAYAMRSIRLAMAPDDGSTLDSLNLVGGGARSTLWPQIFADVFNCDVNVLAEPENVSARGAALIGGKALGWFETYQPGQDFFPVQASYRPTPAAVETYDRLFEVFRQLYPALQPVFKSLAQAKTHLCG